MSRGLPSAGAHAGTSEGFQAKTAQRFEVDADRASVVHVIAHERGGPTTPLEQRPAIALRVTGQ